MRLLSDPQKFYLEAGTSLRKAMNKVIFGKLFVDNGHVTGHELTPGLRELVEAEQRARAYYRASDPLSPVYEAVNDSSPLLAEGAAWDVIPGADLLAVSLAGHGSSKTALVELRGFEPLTPSMRTRCATGLRYSPWNGCQRSKLGVLPAR
jgi:site-specific DNA recombinase